MRLNRSYIQVQIESFVINLLGSGLVLVTLVQCASTYLAEGYFDSRLSTDVAEQVEKRSGVVHERPSVPTGLTRAPFVGEDRKLRGVPGDAQNK